MIVTVVLVFIALAIFATIWWGINRLPLPEPFKTVILVILIVIALLFLYEFVASGGLRLGTASLR